MHVDLEMNNRIKELVIQVDPTSIIPSGGHVWMTAAHFEKFVELIVRDVVDTVKRTQETSPDFEWAILNNYDFGVEE